MSISGAGESRSSSSPGGASSPSRETGGGNSPATESRAGASSPSEARDPSPSSSAEPSGRPNESSGPSTLDRAREVTEPDASAQLSSLEAEPEVAPSDPEASLDLVTEQADVAETLTEGPSLFELDETAPEELTEVAADELLEAHGIEVPDGVEYQTEVVPLPNGENQTVVSYEIDGTSYTRTVFSDGDVSYDTLVSDNGAVRETRATETRTLEGPIEEQLPDVDFGFTIPGERGSLTETTTRFTSADLTLEEPVDELVLESVTYQQHIPLGEDPLDQLRDTFANVGEPFSGRQQAQIVMERHSALELDLDNSGQFLSHTTVTQPGLDGQLQTVEEQSVEFRVEGIADDRPLSYSHELSWQAVDGEQTGGQLVVEEEGLTTLGQVADAGGVYQTDGFLERLGDPGDSLRVRTTTTLPPSPGAGPVERITEWGDYDVVGDGVTFSMREGPGASPNLTHTQVSNGGTTLESQTVYFGTEETRITRAEYAEDGTFSSETVYRDGEEVLSRQTIERELITREELAADLPEELVSLYAEQDGNLFRDTAVLADLEAGTTTETTAFSSETGPITVVRAPDPDGSEVSIIRDEATGLSLVSTADGNFASFDGGQTLSPVAGGSPTDILEAARGTFSGVSETRSQASALNRLNKALQVVNTETSMNSPITPLNIPSSVSTHLDRFGVAFSALGVADALSQGQPIEALRSVAGATTSYASVAGQLGLGGPKPAGAGPSFTSPLQSRILRAGGVLSAGLAVYDLTQGDYKSAALGGATALGLGLIAAPEPVTSAAGLVIVSGATLYSLGDVLLNSDELFATHAPFEFE